MHSNIEAIIQACNSSITNYNLIIPFSVSSDIIRALQANKNIKGLAVVNPPATLKSALYPWLGEYYYDKQSIEFAVNHYPLVFAGSYCLLTKNLFIKTLQNYNFKIFYVDDNVITSLSIVTFYKNVFFSNIMKLSQTVKKLPLLSTVVQYIKKNKWLVHCIKKCFQNSIQTLYSKKNKYVLTGQEEKVELSLFREIITTCLQAKLKNEYVPGRVLLTCASLGPGGAERQLVNTAIGLKNVSTIESVIVLSEYLHIIPNADFYLPLLQKENIIVTEPANQYLIRDKGLRGIDKRLAEIFSKLLDINIEEIINLYLEFKALKPEIVHAWQDSTAIKSALAALMAGVPKIILSSRNTIPIHFELYKTYMKPALQALSEVPHITFLNNSYAGAADYCHWLELPSERFKVVYNGLKLEKGRVSSVSEIKHLRAELNIPVDARVVGSIFRFYEEKRPLLWFETALQIAKKIPNCHFIIVGEGPLRESIRALIDKHTLKNQFHLVNVHNKINVILSIMDVFLLTSAFEGIPNVLLEAQWCGVPVVTTIAGGSAEAIAEGITGQTCAIPQPVNLAEKVISILENTDWENRARLNGKNFVEQKFGFNRMITDTMNIYYPPSH